MIIQCSGIWFASGKYGLSHDQIAKKVSKSRPDISNSLRLLKLPPEIKSSVKIGEISKNHARALLGLKKSLHMMVLYKKIINNCLSVRKTEELVKKYRQSDVDDRNIKKNYQPSSEISQIENNLRDIFRAKVVVKKNDKGNGKIQITFNSIDELNRILDIINEL